jgi:selenoprotein W-related protein
VSLAEHLLVAFQMQLRELKLIPHYGGVFEVTVNGDSVFSKKKTDRFPNDDDVKNIDAAINERLKG